MSSSGARYSVSGSLPSGCSHGSTVFTFVQKGSKERDRVTLKNEIWLLGLALALALYGLSSVWTPLAGISRNAEDSLYEEVIESLLQPFT